jgi:hypothetical protein
MKGAALELGAPIGRERLDARSGTAAATLACGNG